VQTLSATVDCNGCNRHIGQVIQENGTNYYFNLETRNRFKIPDPGSIGNTGRNYFVGPRQFQTDISISKKFRFSERYSFDLRMDAKNLTNTPSFDLPTATFGRIRDGVVSNSRRIQISGKFNF
jgi:hypothetical protein